MTVYVVGYQQDYEEGGVLAVYSSREKAEASWQMRNNEGGYQGWEITEFELDLDPDADKEDIDRRPMYGPETHRQYVMREMFSRMAWDNLTAPSPSFIKNSMPVRTGNTVKFFTHALSPESGHIK